MGQTHSSSPAEEFEELRKRIESRRLRPLGNNLTIPTREYETSDCLSRGDEIARRIADSRIWHHGIYLGDGLVCDLLHDKPLGRIPMADFVENHSRFDVIVYDNDSPEAREDTAKLAIMAIAEPSWKDARYDLLAHNCEHFAKFCRTGRKRSTQSNVGIGITTSVGILALGSVVSVGILAVSGGEKKAAPASVNQSVGEEED